MSTKYKSHSPARDVLHQLIWKCPFIRQKDEENKVILHKTKFWKDSFFLPFQRLDSGGSFPESEWGKSEHKQGKDLHSKRLSEET